MEKLKEYKYIIGIGLVVLGVGFYWYTSQQSQPQTGKEGVNEEVDEFLGGVKGGLTFDIDVSALSYQLPLYTKICLPETKQQCSETGCKPVKPTVFILYDENNSIVYRCDNKPCDSYNVVSNESGLFTILEPIEARAFSIKLSLDNKYIETVGFGLDTLVSHGTCK
ncbi:hypothetical protein IH982_02590 [Patescibacteria group bacterium]|nr:hypothetical protein [Patescibacteria group bacterium]